MRDKLLTLIQAQYDEDDKVPPVVLLDDYFIGNTTEECIAPNQGGYGRPSLAELYERFKAIAQRPDVQTVLVGLHGDWGMALDDPDEWPAAENVHIYARASTEEVEQWIEGLEADGVIEGWPYGQHPSAPALAPGFKVMTVCWD